MYRENLKEKRELEDIKKEVRANSKKLSVQEEKTKSVAVLKQNVEVVQQDIEILKEKLETIGDGGSSVPTNLAEVALTGNYHDLQDRPDEYFEMGSSFKTNFTQVFSVQQNARTTPEFWFMCALDSVIEGTFTISYKPSKRITSISEFAQLMFNGEILEEVEIIVLNPTVVALTFNFKIRPKKPTNYFSFHFTRNGSWTGELVLTTVNIDITYGKNIFFLNRSYNWSATVYKDKYLIFKDGYPAAQYFEKNKDDFDFSVGGIDLHPGLGHSLVMTYAPFYSTLSEYIENMNYNEICGLGYNNYGHYPKVSMFSLNVTQRMMSHEKVSAFSITYFRDKVIDYFGPGIAVVLGEDRRLSYWESGQFVQHEDYTLNGLPVQKHIWADNNAVVKQDMDGVIVRGYKGSVGTKLNGECVFFPAIHSQYVVPLGFGRRVNAFLQDNDNINVYLGRQNHVIKKVLIKNPETNEYEIDKNQELRINGFEEIVETLDGYFIGLSEDEPELVPWEDVL